MLLGLGCWAGDGTLLSWALTVALVTRMLFVQSPVGSASSTAQLGRRLCLFLRVFALQEGDRVLCSRTAAGSSRPCSASWRGSRAPAKGEDAPPLLRLEDCIDLRGYAGHQQEAGEPPALGPALALHLPCLGLRASHIEAVGRAGQGRPVGRTGQAWQGMGTKTVT